MLKFKLVINVPEMAVKTMDEVGYVKRIKEVESVLKQRARKVSRGGESNYVLFG